MADAYEIEKGIPPPPSSKRKTGMTELLRKMKHLDSIVVPNSKRSSVYSCAAQAGIEIRTKVNPDGRSVRVWRMCEDDSTDEDILNNPLVLADPNNIYTPDGELPSGRYTQPVPHGPMVWVNDVDEYGRPVNLYKKKATETQTSQLRQVPTESIFGPTSPDPEPEPASTGSRPTNLLDDILS